MLAAARNGGAPAASVRFSLDHARRPGSVNASVSHPPALHFASGGSSLPPAIAAWLESQGLECIPVETLAELKRRALRGRPRLVLFDGSVESAPGLAACRWLKRDSFTGIVPAVVIGLASPEHLPLAFDAEADEALLAAAPDAEVRLRLDALLRRSDRDTSVHPSTRLPGTFAIEAEIAHRMDRRESFAVCYADLDHFKEFNDRYGYYQGDGVIRMLATILHDVVKGSCGDDGFIGHIGGDDFIFVVPLPAAAGVCQEIISVFDSLIALQYSESDRRAGYFFGKDRRGQLHRVPLMTLSIGVVTNERRQFAHASQVSELATEMKTYAKSLPGSIFTFDRRGTSENAEAPAEAEQDPGTPSVLEASFAESPRAEPERSR